MDWLHKISVTCFAASYLVVFGVEVSRLFWNVKLRPILRIGFTIAGLFAHTVYMVYQGKLEIDQSGIWLSNWTAWCYAAAWLLAVAYLWFSIRKSQSVVGLFAMPLVLLLVLVGIALGDQNSFTVSEAKTGWNWVHGLSLMFATVSVGLGFMFGAIYLVQAKRLKQKKVQSERFRLPSLEWLHRCGERSLVTSTILMGLGLVSGVVINMIQRNGIQGPAIAWSSPVIWSSAVLFLWLSVVVIINFLYKPAQQGRKVAYLVVSSFLFLMIELALVWVVGHATGQTHDQTNEATAWLQINQPAMAQKSATATQMNVASRSEGQR